MTDALTKAIEAGCLALTPENYHSREGNKGYMGVSQYKVHGDCPARWWAQFVACRWQPEPSKAYPLGTYFHALSLEPDRAEGVLQNNKEFLWNKAGTKITADTEGIQAMAERLKNTPEVYRWCQGEHEKIIVGTLGGVYWKIRVDTLNLGEGFFSDLKSAASLTERKYVPALGTYANFIEQYKYRIQFAVYRYILHQQFGKWLRPILVAHQKPTPKVPDPAPLAMEFGEEALTEFDTIIQEVRFGVQEIREQFEAADTGERCGKCEYCAQNRDEWLVKIGPSPFNPYKAEG